MLRISSEFTVREIAGEYVVVATGHMAVAFRGMITVSESAAELWKLLQKGAEETDLVSYLTETYEITDAEASADVREMLDILRQNGILIEE